MKPFDPHARREVQTLRCCGVVYQRWRVAGGRWPGSHHESCVHCGSRLQWPLNYRPKSRLQYLQAWRERCLDRGLTVEGKPRKRFHHPKFKTAAESQANMRKLRRDYYGRFSKRNQAAGLTTRGTKRFDRRTDLERSYAELRATINTSGVSWDSINTTAERFDP